MFGAGFFHSVFFCTEEEKQIHALNSMGKNVNFKVNFDAVAMISTFGDSLGKNSESIDKQSKKD